MSESYAQKILLQIAQDLGRPLSSVKPFIQALEDNWFDTREALAGASDSDFEKMRLPLKIVSLIREKLQTNQNSKNQQNPYKMQEEFEPIQQKPQQFETRDFKSEFKLQIVLIRSEITDDQQLLKTLSTLMKVLQNVMVNPLNPQFYQIKLASKTMQQTILEFNSAIEYLKKAGWAIESEFMVLAKELLDLDKLKIAVAALEEELGELQKVEPPKFNPYKAYFSATTGGDGNQGLTNADVAQKMGYNVFSFAEELEILKQKRYEVMSQRIVNRDVKVFQGTTNQSVSEIFKNLSNQGDFEEVLPSNDPVLREYLKKIAMTLEDQKFASKRKKEYEDLIKKPVYSETVIRIKLPKDIILEAKFAPLETIKNVIDFVQDNLQDSDLKFYIFTTPPVQKMNAKYHSQTLEDMECVPSGLFYFGFEDNVSPQQPPQVLKQGVFEQINIFSSQN